MAQHVAIEVDVEAVQPPGSRTHLVVVMPAHPMAVPLVLLPRLAGLLTAEPRRRAVKGGEETVKGQEKKSR